MAWTDRGPDNCVCFTDLQTSGIALNAGQTAVTSQNLISKEELITLYNVIIANLAALNNNNAVQKSLIAAAITFCSNFSKYIGTFGVYTGPVTIPGYGTFAEYLISEMFNMSSGTGTSFTPTFVLNAGGTSYAFKKIVVVQNSTTIYDSDWQIIGGTTMVTLTPSITLINLSDLTVNMYTAAMIVN